MLKKFKEYLGLPTIAIGGLDSYSPMVSLGKQDDRPPRGKGSRDSRATGLVANYTTQGVGTMNPMLSTPTQPIIVKKELKDQARGFKKKILTKLGKPIKDYLKSKEKKEDTNRIPRKSGQPAGSNKHSDLYTDENPKGTIHGLGFTDAETARTSVNKIKSSGKTHAHKIQAAIAMSQRAKVASQRSKDAEKKKDLGAAHKIYQSYIDTNKKKD
jgi:hypothetical protein